MSERIDCIAIFPSGQTRRAVSSRPAHTIDEAVDRLRRDLRAWVATDEDAQRVLERIKVRHA